MALSGLAGQSKSLASYLFMYYMMFFGFLNFFMVYTLSAKAERGRAPDFDTSDDHFLLDTLSVTTSSDLSSFQNYS
jgi:hypothetical protein